VVLLGTDKGSLALYNFRSEVIEAKSSLWGQINKEKELGVFATTYEKIPQVTSIAPFKCKSVALISLDNGKVYSVEMS